MTRTDDRDVFLAQAGWGAAQIAPLAGDASNRRYDRLRLADGRGAVLMDAPPERGEDTRPFTKIARHLARLGLSPPAIMAEDPEAGFLLIEDLGDGLYARLLEQDPTQELALYTRAVDALVTLHGADLPQDVTAYDPPLMAALAGLAFEWYRPAATQTALDPAPLLAELDHQLASIWPSRPVLVLRDYHAENLLWLPERSGVAAVGLLDFQDAQAGHPAYDLISLLADARRDVSPKTRAAMIDHYIRATGQDADLFRQALGLCGLQRNLRILGVFARLHLRDGKSHYLDLIPRVWNHLQADFAAVTQAELGARFAAALPPPSAEVLDRIRQQ